MPRKKIAVMLTPKELAECINCVSRMADFNLATGMIDRNEEQLLENYRRRIVSKMEALMPDALQAKRWRPKRAR